MKEKPRSKKVKLRISGKEHAITISREALLLLDVPSHICILKSSDGKSLAVKPCHAGFSMSFAIKPKENWTKDTHLRFYSFEFVNDFLLSNGYGREASCVMTGEYDQENNAVCFYFSEEEKKLAVEKAC